MATITGRFAIIIHPENADVGSIITSLSTFDVTPVNVMPYNQWADSPTNRHYDLFMVRENGSWRFVPAYADRKVISDELLALRAEIGEVVS